MLALEREHEKVKTRHVSRKSEGLILFPRWPKGKCDSKLFYFCVKKMEKIRKEAFPPKDVFVQYKQETKFASTCISVDLSWDVAAVCMLFNSYSYPK